MDRYPGNWHLMVESTEISLAALTGACRDGMSRHALSVLPTLKANGGLDSGIITVVTAITDGIETICSC